jgi:hypothetical protein
LTALAASAHLRGRSLTDGLVDLLIATIHRIGAHAERKFERELLDDLKRVSGKRNILFEFSVAGEQTLRDLVEDKALQALARHFEAPEVDDDQAPVRRCHRYLIGRRNQLNYREALANDLPIGSGEIESAHRYIAQLRLKRPGARWPGFAFPSVPALRSAGSATSRPALFVGFTATMAECDFSRPFIAGYGSSPSRHGPARR